MEGIEKRSIIQYVISFHFSFDVEPTCSAEP